MTQFSSSFLRAIFVELLGSCITVQVEPRLLPGQGARSMVLCNDVLAIDADVHKVPLSFASHRLAH